MTIETITKAGRKWYRIDDYKKKIYEMSKDETIKYLEESYENTEKWLVDALDELKISKEKLSKYEPNVKKNFIVIKEGIITRDM